jgi:hypothetical protein
MSRYDVTQRRNIFDEDARMRGGDMPFFIQDLIP